MSVREHSSHFIDTPPQYRDTPSPIIEREIRINPEIDTDRSSPVSVNENILRDSFFEMLGTALFVYISLSGVHQAVLPTLGTIHQVDQVHIALGFAFGLTSGIYVAQRSGGHLNPAVSATFWMIGEVSLLRTLTYILFQCIGGFIGALLVMLIHGNHIMLLRNEYEGTLIGLFGTSKGSNNSLGNAVVDQFIGSALLMVAIVSIPSSKNKPALVGMSLGALALFQGTNGFAFNMARDLAPRVASMLLYGTTPFSLTESWFWVPVVIPFIGMPFGLILCRMFTM